MIPLRYNVRSVFERRATSLMTILGVGMVAMIFVILFGFIGGLQRTLLNAGGEQNWIVLARGAPQENSSMVPHAQVDVIRVRPELATNSAGAPLMSPELLTGVNVSRDNRYKLSRDRTRHRRDLREIVPVVAAIVSYPRWPSARSSDRAPLSRERQKLNLRFQTLSS